MLITQKIDLDMQTPGTRNTVYAKQGDSLSRALEIRLYSGGAEWPVPTGANILQIGFCKPDRHGGIYDTMPDDSPACSVSGNVVTAMLHPQLFTCPGTVVCELRMLNSSGVQLATFSWLLQVSESAVSAAVSEDYYRFASLDALRTYIDSIADTSVKHVKQVLNAIQKAQARSNIGAVDVDTVNRILLEFDDLNSVVVKHIAQSLTDAQQAQARENIGAASEAAANEALERVERAEEEVAGCVKTVNGIAPDENNDVKLPGEWDSEVTTWKNVAEVTVGQFANGASDEIGYKFLTNGNYAYAVAKVNAGCVYRITCSSPTGPKFVALFRDENGVRIGSIAHTLSGEICLYENLVIDVPDGAYDILINSYVGASSSYSSVTPVIEEGTATSPKIEFEKIVEENQQLAYENTQLARRVLKAEKGNDFAWGVFDKAYFIFVHDDTNSFLPTAYAAFHAENVPLSAATVASRISNVYDGKTAKEWLDLIAADGGEVLMHYDADLLNTSEDSVWRKHIVTPKQSLEKLGFVVRGLILANNSSVRSEKGEKFCRCYYDYADKVGVSPQYNIGRTLMLNFSDLDSFKGYIDICAATPGIYAFGFHGLRTDEEWITQESLQEIIQYIASIDGTEITTYSSVFDSIGTTDAELVHTAMNDAMSTAVHMLPQELTEEQQTQVRKNIAAASAQALEVVEQVADHAQRDASEAIERVSNLENDVVKHTEQTLTDAQQAQVRKNIGAAADDPVPDYVISEAEHVIDRILSAQGNRTFTMAVLTDLHYGNGGNTDGVKHACQALKYMDSRFKLDALAVLGDYTDTYPATELENALGDFRSVNAMLDGLRSVPNLRLQGNHDFYADNAHITHRYIQSYNQDVIWGDRLGGYFYRDFDAFKLRVICVNTVEIGNANLSVSATQYQWFANALDLTDKEDAAEWQTLILSHHPLDWYEANGNYVFGRIINAYVNAGAYSLSDVVACDFAGKNAAKLIGNIHGHIHNLLTAPIYRDTGAKLQTGVYRFSSPEACSGRENQYSDIWKEAVSYSKADGTAQDTAFCVYCIDLDAKTVKAVCYGAGYDREIDYSNVSVLYTITNRLTNVTTNNPLASITAGNSYTATLTPDGEKLTSVTVTMGETDITDTVYADGVITIAEVTGDIVITAVGEAAPAYTNLLPLATDADGNAYNGGKGWKNDTRLNSSGVEVSYEGVNVTGFIPVTLGDVIRFKNMKFTAHSSGSYAAQEYLAFYDASKTKLASAIIGYASALCDAGGGTRREAAPSYNLISLDTAQLVNWDNTANKWSGAGNMAYFRISAETISDESIITINEEIT